MRLPTWLNPFAEYREIRDNLHAARTDLTVAQENIRAIRADVAAMRVNIRALHADMAGTDEALKTLESSLVKKPPMARRPRP